MHHAGHRRRARRWIASACVPLGLVALPVAAHAQSPDPTGAIAGVIGASAEVTSFARFEGGATRTLSIAVVPGRAARVDPSAGVQTLMSYSMATRVTVSATPFVGPGGTALSVRLLCARGDGRAPVAALPFDCDAGHVARLASGRVDVLPIAVGVEVDAAASVGAPAGVYTALVTLVATQPGS